MIKDKFTFKTKLNNFAVMSLCIFIITPVLMLLCIWFVLYKLLHFDVPMAVFTNPMKRYTRSLLFLWYCTLKLLFKQNRRNIALYKCALKSL